MAASDTQATKTKVKAKPRAFVRKRKSVKNVLDNVSGIVDVIILDDDIYNIWYEDTLLEEGAILTALEDEGYDAVLMDCGC